MRKQNLFPALGGWRGEKNKTKNKIRWSYVYHSVGQQMRWAFSYMLSSTVSSEHDGYKRRCM